MPARITYDWTADAANAWTIPMGADIGKAFKMGSQDLSLQVGAPFGEEESYADAEYPLRGAE